VTLFDGATPLETQPDRAAGDSSLLFDPNPGAVDPASFVRAEWPRATRVVADGTWHVVTHDQQGGAWGDHYSRVFRSDRRGRHP